MADKPILFSGPMVRAIVEGRKTQTRRIMPYNDAIARHASGFSPIITRGAVFNYAGDEEISRAPYRIGDRLWVKESWRTCCDGDPLPPREMYPEHYPIFYEIDRDNCDRHGRLRPSIFMPRWASRITLLVTDVRVQRLQDISEEDAIAEGIIQENVIVDCHCAGGIHQEVTEDRFFGQDNDEDGFEDAVNAFAGLWDSINAKRGFGWETNPWVVAISFVPIFCNIDRMETSNASD